MYNHFELIDMEDMTLRQALAVLKNHSVETMEKDGKMYALECAYYPQTGKRTEEWKEVKETKRGIRIGGYNVLHWLGY